MKRLLAISLCCLVAPFGGRPFTYRGRGEDLKDEKWPRIDQTQYAGSKKCAECHQTYYDAWKDSAHNKMIRPPKTEGPDRTVLADFSKPSPMRKFELKDVKWVIGHRWKQRFIGEVDGQEVVFPAQWSIKEKK